jgi:hypothetical protein
MEAGGYVVWRRPALKIKRKVHGALLRLNGSHAFTGEAIHNGLKAVRFMRVDGMGRNFDFQVRPDHVNFDVEILNQQDQTEVGILELELIARITTHAGGMEPIAREIDHSRLVTEQRQEVRTQQTSVKLADGIDTTAEQADA